MSKILSIIKNKKNVTKLAKMASKIPQNIDPMIAFEAIKMVAEAYKENEITKREIAVIDAKKEILITKITKEYDLYKNIFENVFAERKEIIKKSFEIIDKGIEENNENYVSMGLKNLAEVVASNPIENFAEFKNCIENGVKIEL